LAGDTAQTQTRAPAFLSGVRVIELTGALAGPYCGMILADLGAEVIKVEPVDGDGMRRRLVGPEQRPLPFDLVHRGKRSLAVNIKSATGQRIVRELAARVDVLIENFSVGALARQGLGYADMQQDCPNLVYCSISGFGQNGPLRHAKGVDLVAQAYGGLMSVTGSEDGQLAKAGYPIGDLGTGMWGALGIVAALHRVRAGQGGAYIDVSLADTIAGWSAWEVADLVGSGEVPGPLGTAHRLAAPYQAFACADGRTLVIGGTDRSWLPLCAVLGVDLTGDPRFATEYERFVNRSELADILQERFDTKPRDHWIDRLREAGVPSGPVNTIDQILVDPQYAARDLFPNDPERFGHGRVVNTPLVSDGAPRARAGAPALGADTGAVLAEIGIDDIELAQLVDAGVVGVGNSADREAR
jgi:crotonobetainyl-CoA:carnitine CoA-transferase CaiB-like acyl-CoA transferase